MGGLRDMKMFHVIWLSQDGQSSGDYYQQNTNIVDAVKSAVEDVAGSDRRIVQVDEVL